MNILRAWLQVLEPQPTRRRPQRRLVEVELPDDAAVADDLPPPRGCAWYDSSLDLKAGLVVRELVPTIFNGYVPLQREPTTLSAA